MPISTVGCMRAPPTAGPQVRVDQHHTPAGVLEQRLAQSDGPLEIDLRVHLAEGAVHPGRASRRLRDGGGLGPAPARARRPWSAARTEHLTVRLHLQQPRLDLLGLAVRTAHPANPRGPTASAAVQPRIRSASRFKTATTPSASNAHSAASIPSSSAASRSEPAGSGRPAPARRWSHYAGKHAASCRLRPHVRRDSSSSASIQLTNVTQPTSCSPDLDESLYAGILPRQPQESQGRKKVVELSAIGS